jgi:hypothetical protein
VALFGKSLEIILVHAERCRDFFNDIMNDPQQLRKKKTVKLPRETGVHGL